MSILLALLIGIAVNLDNFIIGMNIGMRHQKLTLFSNFLIGLTTGICAFFSTYAAKLIATSLIDYTNVIGALVMILFAVYCLLDSLREDEKTLQYSAMKLKDTLVLGFILAINCIPPAFSAGILSLSAWYVAAFCALFSFVSMYAGNHLGHSLTNNRFLKFLAPASSILLILIGLGELFL
ncbi:manganese efflux pump MntP family protein [Murimonas intestini]|uniref:Mn2+ efflux pump MntP n=1 Tax=Murimonas intestini TaxID=1337051 RepID=A0AB73T8Q7_9FIRM|nr:manganese efflux pump [Murimonas intestini]MCR1840030.1 manganese efflux pump [Murimonas intestini]MCR1866868.1 manganese efflux pump [Murimonas intestini]MCR1883701.1 manganese efflux pump [Murimonas intestini]